MNTNNTCTAYTVSAPTECLPKLAAEYIDRMIADSGGITSFSRWLAENLYQKLTAYRTSTYLLPFVSISADIFRWGLERGFHSGATLAGQWLKLVEEFGEYTVNLRKNKDVTDDLGDMLVVWHMLYLLSIPKQLIFCGSIPNLVEAPLSEDLLTHANNWDVSPVAQFRAQRNICRLLENFGDALDEYTAQGLYVAICNLCYAHAITPLHAMRKSFGEIEFRTGKMLDGKFVKQDDLDAMSAAGE